MWRLSDIIKAKTKECINMKNIVRNCSICGHCDEDCPICEIAKQHGNDGTGCIFWIRDTATICIEYKEEIGSDKS